MSEAPASIQNQDVVQHLASQQIDRTQPPAGMTPDQAALQYASDRFVYNRANHAVDSLVSVESGAAVLYGEHLLAEEKSLVDAMDSTMGDLRTAMADPILARKNIWVNRELLGMDEQQANAFIAHTGPLSLEEAKTVLEVRRQQVDKIEYANVQRRDLDEASIDISEALLINWKHRHDPEGTLGDDKVFLDLSDPHTGQALGEHLQDGQGEFTAKFHELTQARVERLGNEILDIADVSEPAVTKTESVDPAVEAAQRVLDQEPAHEAAQSTGIAELDRLAVELADLQNQLGDPDYNQVGIDTRIQWIKDTQSIAEDWALHNTQLTEHNRQPVSFDQYVRQMMVDTDGSDQRIWAANLWLHPDGEGDAASVIPTPRHVPRPTRPEMPSPQPDATTETTVIDTPEPPQVDIPETPPLPQPGEIPRQPAQQEAEETQSTPLPQLEQARSPEALIAEIVAETKKRTHLYAHYKTGFTQLGDGPSHDENIGTGIPLIGDERNKVDWADKGLEWRDYPNEAMSFTKLIDSENVPKHPGEDATAEQLQEYQAALDASARQAAQKRGATEPVVRFRYKFGYGMDARSNSGTNRDTGEAKDLPRYTGYSDARGGHLSLAVDLPESLANQLQALVDANPANVRQLVRELFTNNSRDAYDGGPAVTEHDWDVGGLAPLEPPYKQLPPDWKVTIINGYEQSGEDVNPNLSTNFVNYNHHQASVGAR